MARKVQYRKVPAALAEAILNNLADQPYKQVFQLVEAFARCEGTTVIEAGDPPEEEAPAGKPEKLPDTEEPSAGFLTDAFGEGAPKPAKKRATKKAKKKPKRKAKRK